MSLSEVAWLLSDPQARRLIKSGDGPFRWELSREGFDEALAIQRAAIARGDRPMRLADRREEVRRLACHECFGPRPTAALVRLFVQHAIAVSGVAANGMRGAIDPLLLSQLLIDLAEDKAMTRDGALHWRALAATRGVETVVASPPAVRRTVQSELARWYRETYPSGHPVGRKLDTLAFEATQVLGRTVSTRTMRRALVEARRTTAAT